MPNCSMLGISMRSGFRAYTAEIRLAEGLASSLFGRRGKSYFEFVVVGGVGTSEGLNQFSMWFVQRGDLFFANLVKKDPSRARQNR